MPFSWLVTGCSRGIGLELTRQLVSKANNIVIATCRNPDEATDLHALKAEAQGQLHILKLDMASTESIDAILQPVQEILGTGGLDFLLNNAAMNAGMDTAFSFKVDDLMQTMMLNVAGPGHLAEVLLPLLENGRQRVIMNMSTGLASIGLNYGEKCATYSISKVALNMLTYKQSKAKSNFTVICMDPGWVKTEMGGPGAMLEPRESVDGIIRVLRSVTPADSGKFFRFDGNVLPW
ncbi:hypothetical protein PHLGIDRAFT_131286 [Phlebiopsis gigantea 11061_1 CR5-6]|uniref:C-factor n=1 Tax=Phlebiopsis gigantea (strain 11061_1 CR5-6) TaxID=745531 RepID=A0A0C3RYP3_PHLG1|nr:hypothetical protein PHLGIDRAFT_131286 [Phlebiopsis gigantea 11061_1 CR5-6]